MARTVEKVISLKKMISVFDVHGNNHSPSDWMFTIWSDFGNHSTIEYFRIVYYRFGIGHRWTNGRWKLGKSEPSIVSGLMETEEAVVSWDSRLLEVLLKLSISGSNQPNEPGTFWNQWNWTQIQNANTIIFRLFLTIKEMSNSKMSRLESPNEHLAKRQ